MIISFQSIKQLVLAQKLLQCLENKNNMSQ